MNSKSWVTASAICASLALTQCGGSPQSSEDSAPTYSAIQGVTRARVLAANDLGMHCMDREYSVFSILPPFNVVHAQVIRPGANNTLTMLDASQVDVRYSAVSDPTGSYNSTSIGKTDFWQYASALFGANLAPGQGLTGLYMPADAPQSGPQPFTYDPQHQWFKAFGIPITPTDDGGGTNPYPLLRVSAYDRSTGEEIARTDVVVPVAQETDCSNCHATGGIAANLSGVTWSNDPDLELQTKRNVLLLHDHEEGTNLMAQQPVLCASCHYSAALDLAGSGPTGSQVGLPTMSDAMHRYHGSRVDGSGQPVFPPNGTALQTCYQCHPGATTQCARGAMSNAGMECLNCHGDMSAVGGVHPLLAGGSLDGTNDFAARRPWIDMPRCQSCHTGDALNHLSGPNYVMAADGIRLTQTFLVNDASASPISRPSSRFAEDPNTLYRFSKGHGEVSCEFCHGSTHAEWPTMDPLGNDNKTAIGLQRHAGTVIECAACHTKGVLAPTMNGPHGMHNVGDPNFVQHHEDFFEQNPSSCKACHGANLMGTALSRMAKNRQMLDEDDHPVQLLKGQQVACNLCHEMPH